MKLTDNQETWLTALESGKYKQIRRVLNGKLPEGGTGHCCLGVADVLFPNPGVTDAFRVGQLGFTCEATNLCIDMNDTEELSFTEIASTIRSNPEAYFT